MTQYVSSLVANILRKIKANNQIYRILITNKEITVIEINVY